MRNFVVCMALVLAFIPGFAAPASETLENLLGFSTDFDHETLTLKVASSGCTKKEDFRLVFTNDVLTVYRKKADDCKRMPEAVEFAFPLKQIGINPNRPFSLSNRIIVNWNIANIR